MHSNLEKTSVSEAPAANPIRLRADHPDRREFLRLLGLGFLASYTVISPGNAEAATGSGKHLFQINAVDDDGTTFPQSVGSGDPTPSGMILWTRLAPAAVTGADTVAVEVALDAAFTEVQLRLRVPAGQISATLDHTLRVDLDGRLKANTSYYYRGSCPDYSGLRRRFFKRMEERLSRRWFQRHSDSLR